MKILLSRLCISACVGLLAMVCHADNAANTDSSPYSTILTSALHGFDPDYKNDWAYTETVTKSDEMTVGRYDPRRDPNWTLESYNERVPTPEEIERFAGDKSDRDNDSEDDGHDDDEDRRNIADMVQIDTLSLVEETDQHWILNFIPRDDDDEKFMQFMNGSLKIVKDGHYLAWIDIHSNKPFKPHFGVKVKKFLTRLQFAPAAPGGPVVPMSVDVSIELRAFMVKTVNENVSIRFADYENVGGSALEAERH